MITIISIRKQYYEVGESHLPTAVCRVVAAGIRGPMCLAGEGISLDGAGIQVEHWPVRQHQLGRRLEGIVTQSGMSYVNKIKL